MDEKDRKRLKRLDRQFTVLWFLLLGVIIAIIYWSYQDRKVQQDNYGQLMTYVESIKAKQGVAGAQGLQGAQGIPGVNGKNGTDGSTTVINNMTTVEKTEVQTVQGAKGDKGDAGTPAPELQIQIDPVTGDLETKYSTDTLWSVLVPCNQLLAKCGNMDGSLN